MPAQVCKLLPIFFSRFVGNEIACPDLAMRMRIRAAHDVSLILENLNPAVISAQFFGSLCPDLYNSSNGLHRHFRQRQVMPWRKADHLACPGNTLTAQKPAADIRRRRLSTGQHRRKIIRENVGGRVFGIFHATCALVARTKVALRIVRGTFAMCRSLLPALPRALSPMRRDEDPVAC